MRRFTLALAAVALASGLGGCATWDSMSHRQQSTVVGAGVGGLVGSAVSGGDPLSTVGGAAIGGVIGDQVGKRR